MPGRPAELHSPRKHVSLGVGLGFGSPEGRFDVPPIQVADKNGSQMDHISAAGVQTTLTLQSAAVWGTSVSAARLLLRAGVRK